jgi:type I restriction enzyme S subunit
MKQGWKSVTLGELTSNRPICYGVLKPGERQSIGVPLIRITDIKNNYLDKTNIYHITQSLSDEFKRSILKGGEILLSIQGTVGRVAICPDDLKGGNISRTIAIISPDDSVNKYFLRYWLLSMDGKFPITGATRASLNIGAIRELVAPIPPLDEQKRIVAKLDECFEAIDKARANVEKNLNNAKELFQSQLNEIFSQKGDGWVEKRWGDLCQFVRGPFGGSLKKSMFKESGYVVYEQKHAIHDHFNQLRYFIDEEKFNEMKRFEVKPGDLIMSCSGVTLGKVAIIPEGIQKGIINQALLKLTPYDNILAEFLKYWIRSKIFQDIIFKYSGGAAIPNVPSAKILKGIMVSIPNINIQKDIIREIELFESQTQSLKSNYQQELNALDELKKSILQKAFNGEL